LAQAVQPQQRLPKLCDRHGAKTLIVKLSPNVTNIAEIAKSVEDEGADAVSLINTLLGWQLTLIAADRCSPPLRVVCRDPPLNRCPAHGMAGCQGGEDTCHRQWGHFQRKRCYRISTCRATAIQVGTLTLSTPP